MDEVEEVARAIGATLDRYVIYGHAGNRPSAVYDEPDGPNYGSAKKPIFRGDDQQCIDFIRGIAARAAIATIDRLRSAAPAAEGWRPIETAPKDKTLVLLYAPGREYDGPQQVGCFLPPIEDGDQGCWWLADGRYQDKPTHWQPLPTPPKEQTHG